MIKKLLLAGVVSTMAVMPVAAQETPAAGGGTGYSAEWLASLPTGTWAIIGGVLFFLTADGLNADDSAVPPIGDPEDTTTTTTTTGSTNTSL